MPLEDIVLDDRSFDDLVDEARRRIRTYTPEWTDLNESDPGIALVELFAWLSEMMLYRLNRVPEKNYLKFLQLIGVERQPAVPARAELTFTLTTGAERAEIRQGTRVALAGAVDGQRVVFETDETIVAVGVQTAELQAFDGARYRRVTEQNGEVGKLYHPLGESPQAGSAFYLGFDAPFPLRDRHRLLVHAHDSDSLSDLDDRVGPPPVDGVWEYWAGVPGSDDGATAVGDPWRRLEVVRDETGALLRSGYVEFEAPADHKASKYGILRGEDDDPLYWIRFRVARELGRGYQTAPLLDDVSLNTVRARNAVTERHEMLGASDGLPEQTFELANRPVLRDSLELEVDEGDGFRPWRRVDDFGGSTRESRHYVLEPATGRVLFGDGEKGKIPGTLLPLRDGSRRVPLVGEPGASGLPNIRARAYTWGGGSVGNAGAETITSLESSVPFVDRVTNRRPARFGEDEESIEAVKARAPQSLKTRERAVTASDLEFLAVRTPGARIRRAKALPLRHPDVRPSRPAQDDAPAVRHPVPGVVTVVVVPDDPVARPSPDAATKGAVAGWLRRHALVTTEIHVAEPVYLEVEVEARVVAESTASTGEVHAAVSKLLLDYFHPLRGGPDGEGWPFGGMIAFADLFNRILGVAGVESMSTDDLVIWVDGRRREQCVDVPLDRDELVYSESHRIEVIHA